MLPSLNLLYQIKHACWYVCIPNYALSLICSPQFDPSPLHHSFLLGRSLGRARYTAQPLSAYGFKCWRKKIACLFAPASFQDPFFSNNKQTPYPTRKNPIKVSKSSMGPSSVPSFVPLKGVIGTLSSFGDSFFVKGFRIGRDLLKLTI